MYVILLLNASDETELQCQRGSGQVGQVDPHASPPSEVNPTAPLAENPDPNQDVPSLYALNGIPLSIRANSGSFTLDINDLTTRHFLHSVAAKLPIPQENPSALQVARWLDTTVKIFRSDLPEASSHHLANMLTSKIPLEKWNFLVHEGLKILSIQRRN